MGGAPTALPIREAGGHPVGACCRVLLALRAAKIRDIHAKHHMVIYIALRASKKKRKRRKQPHVEMIIICNATQGTTQNGS